MPDWSYHTLFRPALFTLPAERSRDLTLGAVGALAAIPYGYRVIELFGHMAPPAVLETKIGALKLKSPVILEAGLDPKLLGTAALAHFGVGAIEVGPVSERPVISTTRIKRLEETESIWYPDLPLNPGADRLMQRLERLGRLPVPVGIRLAHRPGAGAQEATEERMRLVGRLGKWADFYVLETRGGATDGTWTDAQWEAHVKAVVAAAHPHPVLIALAPDLPRYQVDRLTRGALGHGLFISGDIAQGAGRLEGPAAHEPARDLVQYLTQVRRISLPVAAGGGVHDPAQAEALLHAGATAVSVHSGLVFSGPGLVKRINEFIAYRIHPMGEPEGGKGWIWGALLGAGLIITSVIAFLVAITSIILPYDLTFLGMSKDDLHAVSPHLLHFMAHDRVSFVGVGAATGLLYMYLTYYGMRFGAHWARQVILISAGWGFLSFFLGFAYGYIEPLHLLMILICLPFYVQALRLHQNREAPLKPPSPLRTHTWKMGQWGHLCFVMLGGAIMVTGLVITTIGVTYVFVPQDLAFMEVPAEALRGANPRLVPVIAHDRVGFGTGLVANGLAILLTSLWGYRQGERWIWWAMLAAGAPSYLAALWTHFSIGYTDFIHLLPVYVGMALLAVALLLSYPYLMRPPEANGRFQRPHSLRR